VILGSRDNDAGQATSTLGNWPDHRHTDRIHFEVTRNADRPGNVASCKPLAQRRTQPVTGIRQHAAKAYANCDHAINLSERDLRLGLCLSVFGRSNFALKFTMRPFNSLRPRWAEASNSNPNDNPHGNYRSSWHGRSNYGKVASGDVHDSGVSTSQSICSEEPKIIHPWRSRTGFLLSRLC
jgi:hypothetical protein